MIFKTTDQGVTWHDLSLNQKINLRGMIFLNADRGLIFGDGGAVFETEDSGQTWTRHYTGITSDLIGGAHGLSGKTILLDASGCILSSTEFGHNSSWGRQRAREGAVALSDDGRLIAGSSGEIVDTVSGTAIRTDALIRCIVGIDPATYAVCGERGFINLIRLSP